MQPIQFPEYGLNPTRKNPKFQDMGSTRPDPNFQNMGSTQPEKTRISQLWAQPDPTWPEFPRYGLNLNQLDPKKPEIRVKMAGLTPQLSGNMGWTNELFKVYGYVPGQKDTKVH